MSRMRLAGHAARMGRLDTCTILLGKPEWKTQLRRRSSRWEDNITMDVMKIRLECVLTSRGFL
jgi:hypothetical protein